MIRAVTFTNYLGDSIRLDLARPEESGFIIKSVTGLGPGKANINTTEIATNDGSEQKDVKTEMLIGLAHDRIMYLGMSYIDRGYVTQDEYENLRVYLYEPYERMGGNGSAKRIMQEVDKLPIHKFIEKEEEHNEHE